jgi:hypothetical protein
MICESEIVFQFSGTMSNSIAIQKYSVVQKVNGAGSATKSLENVVKNVSTGKTCKSNHSVHKGKMVKRMPGLETKGSVLERALIFLRFRLSLRDLFFFHFSLIWRQSLALSNKCEQRQKRTDF